MNEEKKYTVIVIGSSAGGFLALSALLEKLPADYPLPIIVVQHRSKDPNALFEEILQHKCRIRIKQADEKEKIVGATVYVAPPDYHLLIERDGSFSLSLEDPVKFSRPSIDILFETAAEVFRDKLIGIILTGANSDGTNGICAIKRHGGLTIAEDPEEAKYPAMPLSAIESGAVEMVLTLNKMSDFLLSELNNKISK
ncbi:MAG: CheB methylesterase [Bacteroidota bacterium]|nr:CheB methylesterase [Bacteroidota bacterium]